MTGGETQLSLPCGCIVAVWPHGRGDSPAPQAEIASVCRAHGAGAEDTQRNKALTTLLHLRQDALTQAMSCGFSGPGRVMDDAAVRRYHAEACAYERAARLLGWAPEKPPETGPKPVEKARRV